MFACHKTPEGREMACAGWLAAVGEENITVRYMVCLGEIPAEALRPGDDWPVLFDSYRELEETQAA
jgi:hypothetical protein